MWSLLGSSIIALSHLQAHNITHQCLKTQNILLNQQGLLKICHPIAISFPTNYQLLLTR
jgi:serine/threonine protein kinase